MTEPTTTSVDCPVCGEAFEPTAAGGWCTNSDCGEWKYDGEELPDPDDSAATNRDDAVHLDSSTDTASDGSAKTGPPHEHGGAEDRTRDPEETVEEAGDGTGELDGDTSRAGTGRGPEDDPGTDRDSTVQAGVGDGDGASDDPDRVGHDRERVQGDPKDGPSERGADREGDQNPGALGGTGAESTQDEIDGPLDAIDDRLEDVEDTAADGKDDQDEGETTIECPDCGGTFSEETFLSHDVSADAPGEASADTPESATLDGSGEASPPAECPTCGESVEGDANFCPGCGEHLSEPATEAFAECPACGESVTTTDHFCRICGEDLEADREEGDAEVGGDAGGTREAISSGTTDGSHTETLVLRARGREVTVGDGDAVGREFRRILNRTGGEEEDAVRIHRKHVRFVRDGGEFDLIALGENPTAINGREIDKGDRRPVGPGDTITLSNVLTAEVEAP